MTSRDDKIVQELQAWFMDSKIHAGDGAYAMYYSPKGVSEVYPEITAYAITVGALLFERTKQPEFLERARMAAEYMIRIGSPAVPGVDGTTHFTFDTGIFIDGLLTLAAHDPDNQDRWLDYAERSLQWMAEAFAHGAYPSVVPASKGTTEGYDWHLRQSMHLTKLAIPFIKGALVLENSAYEQLGRDLLDWGMTLQADDGRLRINSSTQNTRLHPHSYALEGLVYSGAALNEAKYTDAGRRGGEWLASVQKADGSFPQWHPDTFGPLHQRVGARVTNLRVADAPSQAIRIWKVLSMGEAEIQKAQDFLEKIRPTADGLPLHRRTIGPVELGKGTIYSWPTFFYLHACMLEFGETEKSLELF